MQVGTTRCSLLHLAARTAKEKAATLANELARKGRTMGCSEPVVQQPNLLRQVSDKMLQNLARKGILIDDTVDIPGKSSISYELRIEVFI